MKIWKLCGNYAKCCVSANRRRPVLSVTSTSDSDPSTVSERLMPSNGCTDNFFDLHAFLQVLDCEPVIWVVLHHFRTKSFPKIFGAKKFLFSRETWGVGILDAEKEFRTKKIEDMRDNLRFLKGLRKCHNDHYIIQDDQRVCVVIMLKMMRFS